MLALRYQVGAGLAGKLKFGSLGSIAIWPAKTRDGLAAFGAPTIFLGVTCKAASILALR
jgi:hypothetical protein